MLPYKEKINNLWEKSEENQNKSKEINKVTVELNPNIFNKKIVTIPIIFDGFPPDNPTTQSLYTKLEFEGLPEWTIPFIKIIPVYSIFDPENPRPPTHPMTSYLINFFYIWNKGGVVVSGSGQGGTNPSLEEGAKGFFRPITLNPVKFNYHILGNNTDILSSSDSKNLVTLEVWLYYNPPIATISYYPLVTENLSLYMDLNLWFFNPRVFHEIQKHKS